MDSLRTMGMALGLAVALFTTSQQAQAGGYGSFVLRNPNRVTIYYQVKWGNGDWQSYSVPAGYSKYHYYPLDENGHVPSPQVRFDYIAGDSEVTYKTYSVGVYATYYPERGKKYVFRYSASGYYLDLYSE
jgi:hypothetical protein